MRPHLFVGLLLLVITQTFAQQIQRIPAKILDFGQLYSTFDWNDGYKSELQSKLGTSFAETVIASSTESSWPSGIASLNERTDNRTQMAAYTVYYLTTISENLAIMVAPANENTAISANMKPANDIYFVLSLSAVELNAPSKSQPIATPLQDQSIGQEFSVQLNHIVQDFGDGFVNLTGSMVSEEDDGMVVVYESLASLEGSTTVYFVEDLLGATTIFYAEYPGSIDPAVSLTLYRRLVKKIAGTKLSICSLSKEDELVVGNQHTQAFGAYDPAGKLDISYQSMMVEVRIEQKETFDAKGQLVNNWVPVVSIYEQ